MILVDPDLDADPSTHERLTKKALSTDSAKTDRNTRVPSTRVLSRFLREAQAAVRLRGHVSVLLTTDRAIRRLNRHFRGKDKATDVLSFPAEPLVRSHERITGDLAISVPTALRQAGEQGHPLSVEIKVLILHGLLHLAGFDHEADDGQMARREWRLRAKLGLPPGLIERSEAKPSADRARKTTRHKKRTSGAKAQIDRAPNVRAKARTLHAEAEASGPLRGEPS